MSGSYPKFKGEEMKNTNLQHPEVGVKKQTFYSMIILSLIAGFVAGTVYTSFKLAGQTSAMAPAGMGMGNMPPKQAQQQEDSHDHSEEAAQILKLEQHLAHTPDDADAWAHLGNLFFDTHRHADAIEAYEKSLSLKPGVPGVMTDLSVMYRKNEQSQKAVEILDQVTDLHPEFEKAWFNKGIILLHDLNDFDKGIQAWEELVRINPMAAISTGESVSEMIRRMKQNRQDNQ